MKNYGLSLIIDCILTFIICFLGAILCLSSLKINYFIRLALCLIFSVCLSLLVFLSKLKRQKKIILSKKRKKQFENMLFQLEVMPYEQTFDFLKKVLTQRGVLIEITNGQLFANGALCLFDFSHQTSRRDFCLAIKEYSHQKILFFCNQLSEDCASLIAYLNKNVKIINGEILFSLVSANDFAPLDEKTYFSNLKNNLRVIKAKIFTKKRALGFAFLSAILLLFSHFTFFPNYYKTCSVILIIFSAFCLIFGKNPTAIDSDPLAFE